jgi:hypothetical protein
MTSTARTLTAGLAAAATAALCVLLTSSPAHALTQVKHEVAQGGDRFEVHCNQPTTVRWALPAGATNVKVLEPVAGTKLEDGFGRDIVATVQSVTARTEGATTVVEITVVGTDKACSYPGAWDTNSIDFRATYDRVVVSPVLFSDDVGGIRPRQRPTRISAGYQKGWRNLRWQSWGGTTATGRGRFVGQRVVAVGPYARIKSFSYPVRVTLYRVKVCGGGGLYYTRIRTTFVGRVPAVIRRQAKPLGTAGCLD